VRLSTTTCITKKTSPSGEGTEKVSVKTGELKEQKLSFLLLFSYLLVESESIQMVAQQQQIQPSPYSGLYDLIVPQDNLLRKINDLVDFTFIYEELASKY